MFNKGDVYYISKTAVDTHDTYVLEPGRPAVIVSVSSVNNVQNTCTIVYMTSKPKLEAPTNVVCHLGTVSGTLLCSEPVTIDKCRIGKFVGKLNPTELAKVDAALCHTLGITVTAEDSTNVESLKVQNKKLKQMLVDILQEGNDE